jgi:indolepyruvate ferredoxin oxidoreductase
MGDSIATNMFMLGYAYQKGWVPLSATAMVRAIQLNGVAVEFNVHSFQWGRRAAVDPERVRRLALPAEVIPLAQRFSRDLAEIVEKRVKLLTGYQNAAYAARFKSLVERVRDTEAQRTGSTELTETVARNYAKLMAYKDEYEVARLYSDDTFKTKIESMFEGEYKLVFHLAPPLLAKPDPVTGEPKKMRFGGWTMGLFRVLAKLKGLRGTALDVFGSTEERRTERALIGEYEQTIDVLLETLSADNRTLALQIAALPEEIRGFGHIKLKSVAVARTKREELLRRYNEGGSRPMARAAA